MNTTTRRLRLSPRDVMTGDRLEGRVVTNIEPRQGGRFWLITTAGTLATTYAVQRRVTVERTGPQGLGESR